MYQATSPYSKHWHCFLTFDLHACKHQLVSYVSIKHALIAFWYHMNISSMNWNPLRIHHYHTPNSTYTTKDVSFHVKRSKTVPIHKIQCHAYPPWSCPTSREGQEICHPCRCLLLGQSIFHPIALVVETLGAGVSLLGRLLPASVDCRDNVWVCHTCSWK